MMLHASTGAVGDIRPRFQSKGTRMRERPVSWHVVALLGWLIITGCAVDNIGENPESLGLYAPAYPLIVQYSRNPIVCGPTAIGNLIAAPLYSTLDLPVLLVPGNRPGHRTPTWDFLRWNLHTVALTPVLVGGAITGTGALPFSYLADKQPCGFH